MLDFLIWLVVFVSRGFFATDLWITSKEVSFFESHIESPSFLFLTSVFY